MLAPTSEAVVCEVCGGSYPCFDGIPDLRLPGPAWIDFEQDRNEARRFLTETTGFTPEETVRHVFLGRKECSADWVQKRTRQVMQARDRLCPEISGWLRNCLPSNGIFLDLGCGPGQLLAAAAMQGYNGIGIDVRLVWLLVAKRLIADVGGTPVLAAAMAEFLPLGDGSINGVVSLDVIEHVGDVKAYLQEMNRVAAPDSYVALATPNRFSLAAEPHVDVWGVGWVPRRWQKRYVEFRSGRSYEFTRLLSSSEVRRLFGMHTKIAIRLIAPPVPIQEIAFFPYYRKALARAYNFLVNRKVFASLFLLIGPFFRIVGRKSPF